MAISLYFYLLLRFLIIYIYKDIINSSLFGLLLAKNLNERAEEAQSAAEDAEDVYKDDKTPENRDKKEEANIKSDIFNDLRKKGIDGMSEDKGKIVSGLERLIEKDYSLEENKKADDETRHIMDLYRVNAANLLHKVRQNRTFAT
jgi:hypothetical protein